MGRYSEYCESGAGWLGELPSHWQLQRISALYDARNEKVSDQDYPPLSVTMQGIVPQLETAAKTQDGDNRKLVRTGDFVINSRSDRRGACGISAYDGSVTLISNVLAPKDRNAMSTRYYSYLFRSEGFADEFYRQGTGIVDDLWSTNWTRMKNILVARPPLAEQESIADYLDAKTAEIDALVADCEREVGLLQEYRKSLITEVMTKGLNPTVPMYDSGIESVGLVPEGWRVYKLRWLCSFHNGDRGANYPSAGDFQDSGIPFYGADALVEDIVDSKQARFITRERYNSMGGLKIQAFDTLYTLRGSTIGKNAIAIDPEGTVASSLIGIRVRNLQDIDPWYLHYWLNSYQEYQQRDACINGSTAPNLSAEDVAQYRIALPPRELQDEMVKAIRARIVYADSLISDKQHMVDKLREYRRSLISEAVTGKFKVPGV
ncbi:MAG: restriction endonuclease subunit S [Clostridia bacterium]|nr:restriction endonuclease subunit S [Clostridia bacterium]